MRIILASKSPRRKELLGKIYESFEVITKETDETLSPSIHPREGVAILAERKGRAVLEELLSVGQPLGDTLIISSDTLVELDGEPLGKPEDRDDAIRMLRSLSDKRHSVHTGIAVYYNGAFIRDTATTDVYFRAIGDDEIRSYVDSGDPMDKAGAYAIQGEAGKFVDRIDGDFDTVVGLSSALLTRLIGEVTEK